MTLPVILRPAADADIQATYDELEQSQAGLGDRFVARLREVLERIEAMPEMYGLVWQDVRAARLKQFRHLVYFVVFPDRVEVLAVMHGSRQASAWRSRVEFVGTGLSRPGRRNETAFTTSALITDAETRKPTGWWITCEGVTQRPAKRTESSGTWLSLHCATLRSATVSGLPSTLTSASPPRCRHRGPAQGGEGQGKPLAAEGSEGAQAGEAAMSQDLG